MGLKNELENELSHLRMLQEKLKNLEDPYPGETVRISSCKSGFRYYIRSSSGEYAYISKKNLEKVKEIAQYEYNLRVRHLLNKRIHEIKALLNGYSYDEVDQVYEKLHVMRQKLILPVEETCSKKYERWINEPYNGKTFGEEVPTILTEKGERVRSKSEKILADYFTHHGIEYKYEKPLYLKEIGIIYPDFTFWSKERGCEIYWEHDGRMDDPNYANSATRKINTYINNGILPGERLILTFETSTTSLDMRCVEKLVKQYLL